MERTDSTQKQLLIDPVYKSNLVYRPSDFTTPKYYEEYDMESQKEDEKAILANAFAERRAKRRRSWSMCCCAIGYFILIILLVAAIVVVKLVPKNPALSLGPDLQTQQFLYNSSTSSLTVQVSYNFSVTNRNPHADAIYSEINLSLLFQNESLGSFSSSPGQFEQKKKHTTEVVAELPVTVTSIQNQENADTLRQAEANKNVQVILTGNVNGRFKVLGLKVKSFSIPILCMINLQITTGGSEAAVQRGHTCYVSS